MRAFAALAFLSACAAQPPRLAPAELRASLPVQYRASLAGHGFEADEPREAGGKVSERASERCIDVEVSVLRAERADGSAAGPAAWIASEAEAARLRADAGELVLSPRLKQFDGLLSTFAVEDQRAFVGSFELTGDGQQCVADPVVETLVHGTRFDVRARLVGESAVELELTWNTCEPDDELPLISHALPIGGTSVSVQIPLALSQEISTRARLRAGERLVVSCPDAHGRQRLAIVSACPSLP